MQELLPVKYYHVVFTLPHALNPVIMGHRKLLFKLLMDASAQTLLSFSKDPKYLGAMPGITPDCQELIPRQSYKVKLGFEPAVCRGSTRIASAYRDDWSGECRRREC